jgi:hypothetical protein
MATNITLHDRSSAQPPLHCEVPAPVCDGGAFVEAQSNARQWADNALESLRQGDCGAASSAETQAEMWLATMLEIEAQMNVKSRPVKGVRTYAFIPRPLAFPTRAKAVSNSVMLREWKRPPRG